MNPEEERPPLASPEEVEEELRVLPAVVPGRNFKDLTKNGDVIKTVIIAFIVTFVFIMGMAMMGGGSFVTKSDFETNWANMQVSVTTSLQDLEKVRTTLNNAIEGIPSMVSSQTTTAISNATNQLTSQLNALSTKVTTNTNDVDVNKSRITVLETEISNLEADIIALEIKIEEEEKATEAGDNGSVEVDLKSWGDVAAATGTTVLDTTYKVTVTNNSTSALEDVVFTFILQPSPSLPSISAATLSGGYTVWYNRSMTSYALVFQNNWGFDMEPGETKKVLLALHMEFGAITTPTMFDAEIEIDDYDIVK